MAFFFFFFLNCYYLLIPFCAREVKGMGSQHPWTADMCGCDATAGNSMIGRCSPQIPYTIFPPTEITQTSANNTT